MSNCQGYGLAVVLGVCGAALLLGLGDISSTIGQLVALLLERIAS